MAASRYRRAGDVFGRDIIRVVSDLQCVSYAEIVGQSRRRATAYARQHVCYLAVVHFGMSSQAVGRLIRRDHSTVLHAIRVIEGLRQGEHGDIIIAFHDKARAEIREIVREQTARAALIIGSPEEARRRSIVADVLTKRARRMRQIELARIEKLTGQTGSST